MEKESINYNPPLETDRLILRRVKVQDTSDIYEYSSNKKIDEYVGWDYHKSIDDTTKFVQNILDKYSDNLPSEWGIIYKKEGKIIGTCGFEQLNLDHKSAGIGYVLSRKY